MRKTLFIVIVALAAFAVLPASSATASSRSLAYFEGHYIDLRSGWGEAQACAAVGDSTTCFRTEAAMRDWLTKTRPMSALSSCESSLELFEDTGYNGTVLYLLDEQTWIYLGNYGFNDKTSSYINGSCDSIFAEHASGGGNWYPGNTSAWAYSPSMVSGWNDRISSVWLS
jgi:hypothetical protein